MSARALWACPECQEKLTAEGPREAEARTALQLVIRAHLDLQHDGARGVANAAAQARSGWLSAAGHRCALWGGPEDGAELVLPPGPLPPLLWVHRDLDGHLVPVWSAAASAYLRGEPGARYRLIGTHSETSAVYQHDWRARWADG